MTIALQETTDRRIRMSFPYSADDLNFVKTQFAGRQYDDKTRSWIVPVTDRNIEKIRANRGRFGDAEAMLRRIQQNRAVAVEASQAFAASETFRLRDGLQGELRPYQAAGVEFITKHAKGKAYIGDEMGLGKTITALAAMHQEQAYPALVVCPSVVVGNWKREANAWLPDKTVQIIKTGKDVIDPKADIVVASYALAGKVAAGKRFAQVVCDEAHYLKNKDAKRTQEIAAIAKLSPRRLMLSGTPVTNKPKDLFQQLEIIDVTGKGNPLGSFFQFATQYCGGRQGKYGFEADGATNVAELNQRLRDGVYLRRDKSQVLTDLPEKQRQTLYVEASAETKRRIKEIRAQYAKEKSAHVPGATLKAMTHEQSAMGSGKIEAAGQFLEDFADTGKKLIVFAYHVDVQKALLQKAQELGMQPSRVLGEDSSEKRTNSITAFQENPDVRCIICSLDAANVGIDLTVASDVLMVEQDWTPMKLNQAEDRAHRSGQKNAVNVTYLVMPDTLDEVLQEVIEHKRNISADLNQDVKAEVLQAWTAGLDQAVSKGLQPAKSKGMGL